MKKVAYKFSMLAFLVVSVTANASPYIDNKTKSIDVERKEFIKKQTLVQCGLKASYACESKVYKQSISKFPMRGSKEYSQEHYGKYSKSQAAAKLKELGIAYNNAERFSNHEPGEVTQAQLEQEGWWIVKNILKIDRYGYQLVLPWVEENGKPIKGINPSA